MNKKKYAYVTGGAGYIGSHMCKVLYNNGIIPISIDNLSTGNQLAVKWGPLEKGDILDSSYLNKVFKKYESNILFHFAAFSNVAESVKNPSKYYSNNVSGTINLLQIMEQNNIRNIIFSSSCAIYNESDLSLDEDSKIGPTSPYGNSKLIIEKILNDYKSLNKLNFISLRYFNAAGADYDTEIGEYHNPETHVIPTMLNSSLSSKKFKIFGSDYPTSDGTTIRDYIHVMDLAEAHFLAMQYLINNQKSEFINLGSGSGHSILSLVKAFDKNDIKIDFDFTDRRLGDSAKLVANIDKAKRILNWMPQSSLDEIIITAKKWHLKENKFK